MAHQGSQEINQLRKAQSQGALLTAIHLRWLLNPAVGLPLQPFRVWWRKSSVPPLAQLPGPGVIQLGSFPVPVTWNWEPMAIVELAMTVNSRGSISATSLNAKGHVLGFTSTSTPGPQVLRLCSDQITSLLLSGQGTLTGLSGISADAFAALADWQEVEMVRATGYIQ